jgi:hypothetical protein
MTEKNCAGCHAVMEADAIFCNECGLAQPSRISVGAVPAPDASRDSRAFGGTVTSATFRTCPRCSKRVDASVKFCSGCALDFSTITTPAPPSSIQNNGGSRLTKDGSVLSQELNDAAKKRYRDGYRVARAINGYGGAIKAIGFLISLVICIAGFVIGGGIADQANRGPFGGPGAGVGVVIGFIFIAFGVVIGVVFWIIGVLYMAQAQRLKASLDSAVNSSPFLADLERAEMMSLPTGSAKVDRYSIP